MLDRRSFTMAGFCSGNLLPKHKCRPICGNTFLPLLSWCFKIATEHCGVGHSTVIHNQKLPKAARSVSFLSFDLAPRFALIGAFEAEVRLRVLHSQYLGSGRPHSRTCKPSDLHEQRQKLCLRLVSMEALTYCKYLQMQY